MSIKFEVRGEGQEKEKVVEFHLRKEGDNILLLCDDGVDEKGILRIGEKGIDRYFRVPDNIGLPVDSEGLVKMAGE